MKKSIRIQRIGDQIQKKLAVLIQTFSQDEKLDLITLSAVQLNKNLLYAKVFFTYLDDGADEKKTEFLLNVLNAHSPKFRNQLSQNLHLRVVPQLEFVYDYHLQQANKMIRLIDNLQTK